MDARKGNIYEILNENKQFLIPVYQRFYSWDIDQCKRLWNDIVEMQRKSITSIVTKIVTLQRKNTKNQRIPLRRGFFCVILC